MFKVFSRKSLKGESFLKVISYIKFYKLQYHLYVDCPFEMFLMFILCLKHYQKKVRVIGYMD